MGLLAITLTLSLALSAADATPNAGAVIVTRRSGLSAAQAAELRGQLERALTGAGLPLLLEGKALTAKLARLGVKDSSACNGRLSCVLELGRQLATPVLVAANVSRVDGDSAVALELIRVDGEATLAKEAFVVPKGEKQLSGLVAAFVEAAKRALNPRPPEPEPVAVVTPTSPPPPVLVPTTPPPGALVEPAPAPVRTHTAGIALGAAGIAAAIAGGALLAVSLSTRATLSSGTPQGDYVRSDTGLTEREAQARAMEADALLGAGAGAAAVGLGLLVGGVIAW